MHKFAKFPVHNNDYVRDFHLLCSAKLIVATLGSDHERAWQRMSMSPADFIFSSPRGFFQPPFLLFFPNVLQTTTKDEQKKGFNEQ